MKKTSLISYTREALKEAADDIIAMAEAEGLKPMPMPSASAKGNYKKGGSR